MVLEGQKFSGYFQFEGHAKILKYTLDKVDTVETSSWFKKHELIPYATSSWFKKHKLVNVFFK